MNIIKTLELRQLENSKNIASGTVLDHSPFYQTYKEDKQGSKDYHPILLQKETSFKY